MACKWLASSTFAVSVGVPGVEQKLACDAHTKIWLQQKLACDAHTLIGVEHAPTVPPGGDANKTDRVGGDFAATLEYIAMNLLKIVFRPCIAHEIKKTINRV